MKIQLTVILLTLTSILSAATPQDLEFLEQFAWGNRETALKELVPDTEDYYYYHCLHYQLENDRTAFHKMLQRWLKKNKNRWNNRMREMERRQKLIEFNESPAQTWAYLKQGMSFHHRRRSEVRNPNYPSALAEKDYNIQSFIQDTKPHGGLLNRVTGRGLELVKESLSNPNFRRAYLGQLQRPDLPGVVDLILADLEVKDSRGFGHHSIHRLLTREQLEELGRRKPELLRDGRYITERLARIQPPEVDLSHDHETAVAYYTELWEFVKDLGSMHNSLKASTLYRLLDHQRKMGVYEEELFRRYLEFPRQVYYLDRNLRNQWNRQRADWVNFGYRPGRQIILPPIGQEEPLVKDFLITFLKDDPDLSAYETYFETGWLRTVFAESKILNGIGKPEDWANLLTPQYYRQLLDRIELNFAPENPNYVRPGDDVNLLVDLKRVDSLMVKIYEMQTFNYYTTYRSPVDQAVDLDGMVPTFERKLDTAAHPGRRVRHTLEFPEINKRGVYVVELIGNGVSSRALLHVGHLEVVTRASSAGQVALVLNDAGEVVKESRIWLNGREFEANAQGLVLLPFSENPGPRFVVLRDGTFSSPDQIQHLGESYTFTAGIQIDRQSLNRRSTATLILRPDLRIHGIPIDPKRLGEVTVTLSAWDQKGTSTDREFIANFERDQEWAQPFYVPDGLRGVTVIVKARIKRRTDLEEIELADQAVTEVNTGRQRDQLHQAYLQPTREGWMLEVKGLNGEPIAGEPVRLDLFHPGFKHPRRLHVTTDRQGRVSLGSLGGISRMVVSGNKIQEQFPVVAGNSVLPSRLHLQPGQLISLPYPWERKPDLQAATLLKVGRGVNLEDLGDLVRIADGQLVIEGLEAGTYKLTLHEPGLSLDLEIVEGKTQAGFILGETRRLLQGDRELPSVAGVEGGEDTLTVRLRNLSPGTRIAARAYRYSDPNGYFHPGQGFAPLSQRTVYPPHSQFVSGREIGDEYRYVLERQLRNVFAGTLLERPGLILNPWKLRETTADQEKLKADRQYRGRKQRLNAPVELPMITSTSESSDRFAMDGRMPGSVVVGDDLFGGFGGAGGGRGGPVHMGYDFLPDGSRWWVNLVPEQNGTVTIPLKELGEHTAVDILLLDRSGTTRVRQLLPDAILKPKEVRLLGGLDPEQTFSRQKTVRLMTEKEPVVFPDFATTRYQVIRDFAQAFDLLETLSGDPTLSEFAFLKEWSGLDEKEKRKKYGTYASHELHLFLYQRDREFFEEVVKPYLSNKKDKTFVDRWLLQELTPEDTRLDRLQNRNALELALLSRRGGDAAAMQAALRETWELLPPDPDGFARRVEVALQAGELDEKASLDRDKLKREAEGKSTFRSEVEASRLAVQRRVDPLGGKPMNGVPASRPAPEPSLAKMAEMNVNFAADSAVPMEENEDGVKEVSLQFLDDIGGFEEEVTRLYRALPKTKEWAEQNYYQVRAHQDLPGRVTVTEFWRDVAAGTDVSPHLLQSHRTLTDVLAALAFCGLPESAEEPVAKPEGAQLTLSVAAPAILVTEQVLPAELSEDDRPLLLSQQFFRPDDMHRFEGNERVEKFVTGEFIRRTVYGARVTLTNPTASRRRLSVLLQIPLGAIPVHNGFYTDDKTVLLQPYTTQKVEYFFTFPESGTYQQFPAHASANEKIIGKAEPRVFEVKDAPTEVDKTSWAWISQYATEAETLTFLREHNVRRHNLDEMAWRLRDQNFFRQAIRLLTDRGFYHGTTFSYGVYHEDIAATQVWMEKSGFGRKVGPVFTSPLLEVDPLITKTYEHLEYDPLVNPRAHDVGAKRKILNQALRQQYRTFLHHSLYRAELDASEKLALVYYLQLQDRLEEAFAQLATVDAGEADEKLQLTYLQAWMALRELEVDRALALAKPFVQHPVPRWRNRFSSIVNAVEEARGGDVLEVEDPSRQQDLDQLASKQPGLELETVSGEILITTHHLNEVTLNLYPMDIELLFSRKPFLAEGGQDFAVIKPALSRTVKVKGKGEQEVLKLPRGFEGRNLMVEVTAKGLRESVAWYANQLNVRKIESYGQVEVRSVKGNRPLPKTYVKVFARGADGNVRFWKDGYTDLRGRFDYLSLNDRQPEEAAEFSILILHPELGAEILQAEPPTR